MNEDMSSDTTREIASSVDSSVTVWENDMGSSDDSEFEDANYGKSKRRRKNIQEWADDDNIRFVSEQLCKIADELVKLVEGKSNKIPHLYREVMSMLMEGFDDEFLCNVFDYLEKHELEA